MNRLCAVLLLVCATTLPFVRSPAASAAGFEPIRTAVTVDAGRTIRAMDPQRLGGTNIAMWIGSETFESPQVRQWVAELRSRYIRLPGGSWSNIVYWNGNGVRGADGQVDPGKVGPDGYPAVDYSAYAPSFLVDEKTLHPRDSGWHGNVDVKTLQDWVKSIPGAEPLPCPNAGTGRAVDAAEWVKWAKRNGYGARYWEIGNELGGSWEAGTELPFGKGLLTGEMYARRYNGMADAMRAVDPAIRIGGGAFAEDMLRDCGENVDFVSIHTYPGSTTATEAEMLADVARTVEREVGSKRSLVRQYQPEREEEIEIAYTEWNLGGGVSASDMFSGLWASVFLGEMARNGVDFATQWDCFTHTRPNADGHALIFGDGPKHVRKPEYYALWLWNNYMGDRLIAAESADEAVYTYASRSDDAVYVMLINADRDREAEVDVKLSGFAPADSGELATVTNREYYWNPLTHLPQWSTGPRVEPIRTGSDFGVTLAPFSMTYLRIPSEAAPELSPIAMRAPAAERPVPGPLELRFAVPGEIYVGDSVRGALMALTAGTNQAYRGVADPAALTADGEAELDRNEVRLAESVGPFVVKPMAPGTVTLTAESGGASATHTITVKPSVARPVVFWDFADPPVSDDDVFHSDFDIGEDLTQRANQPVARVEFPREGVVPSEQSRILLQVKRLPGGERLAKENIRGVVFDVMTSPDFACEDPDAGITVVMQSEANWWMQFGDAPLPDAGQWKTHEIATQLEDHIKAMPAALNVWLILKANRPVKGSVYIDRVGFMVR